VSFTTRSTVAWQAHVRFVVWWMKSMTDLIAGATDRWLLPQLMSEWRPQCSYCS